MGGFHTALRAFRCPPAPAAAGPAQLSTTSSTTTPHPAGTDLLAFGPRLSLRSRRSRRSLGRKHTAQPQHSSFTPQCSKLSERRHSFKLSGLVEDQQPPPVLPQPRGRHAGRGRLERPRPREGRGAQGTYLLAIQPADAGFPGISRITLPEDTQTLGQTAVVVLHAHPAAPDPAGGLARLFSHLPRKSPSHWTKPVAKLGGVLAPTAQGRKNTPLGKESEPKALPAWAAQDSPSLSLPSLLSSPKALQVHLDLLGPENKQSVSAVRHCTSSGGLCSSQAGVWSPQHTPSPRAETPLAASQAPCTAFPSPSLPGGAFGSALKALDQQNFTPCPSG